MKARDTLSIRDFTTCRWRKNRAGGPPFTSAEKDKAFRINFSCLTALRECRHPCDVLPEAWRELRVLHPGERGDSMDADCRKAGR